MRTKIGCVLIAMPKIMIPRIGIMTRKINDIFPLMEMAITTEKMIISGARKAPRTSIAKAFWTFVTSVVMRVTREASEKRSMSWKE